MAVYDYTGTARKQKSEETYEALKKHLLQLQDNKVNEFALAYEHMLDMEKRVKEAESELTGYRKFFSLMSSLMPKQFTTQSRIGYRTSRL